MVQKSVTLSFYTYMYMDLLVPSIIIPLETSVISIKETKHVASSFSASTCNGYLRASIGRPNSLKGVVLRDK